MTDIDRNLLALDVTLRGVLERLNEGIDGAVFLLDEEGVMQGLLTDGDVRRALLAGADLDDSAREHMTRDFVAGSASDSRDHHIQLLNEKIRHLPILDEAGRPVDMISWAEMWKLPVMEPSLGGNELTYVTDCVTSNWISSQGRYVSRFEDMLGEFIGVPHAVSTSSGTAALHLALTALGIGPGDEVLVPDLTFGACGNVVLHCGADPVFVDVNPETWTMDPASAADRISERTRAIMPVHLYGHPCDMDPLLELADEHELFVVEDCAEALGAKYKGDRVGKLGDVGIFSFYANKVITTGEGGMVTTRDPEVDERLRLLRDHGMSPEERYWHTRPGFNYRMTNLQAAVGVAQMERIESFLSARRGIIEAYRDGLEGLPGLTLPPNAPWATNIHWLFSILVDEQSAGISRDVLQRRLEGLGIETRRFFYPLHEQPAFKGTGRASSSPCPVASDLSRWGLCLPTANHLTRDEVQRVCDEIRKVVDEARLVQQRGTA